MNIRNVLLPTDFSETAARAMLAATAEALTGDGAPVETALAVGTPATAIVRYADEHQIDLIVMGTHGRTGVSRALLGSVVEAVVRRAPCLVLAVPPPSHGVEAASAGPNDAMAEADVSTCIVCATPAEDLICPTCRDRIRAEAFTAKRAVEHAGRRGLPV